MEFYIGQIIMFGGNFAIRNFAFAQGQLMPINQNTALFSIYGTYYGGDGRSTFALPDLRGRAAISSGQGPGLNNYQLGSRSGNEYTQLTTANLPSHTHQLYATADVGNTNTPTGAVLANTGAFDNEYMVTSTNFTAMSSAAVSSVGSGQQFSNRSPFLTINYEVCLMGIFPSRS